ncbi:MAG: alpha/beta hydrolase [Microbacteriaceae bacterium]
MPHPVVLVPGLGGAAAEWDPVIDALGTAGVDRVVAVELPGHGSRRDEDFGWGAAQHAVRDAAATFEEPVLLVGRGVGAHAAIAAARAADSSGAAGSAAAAFEVAGVVALGIGTETLGWFVDSYRVSSAVSALLPDRGLGVGGLAGQTFAGRAGDGGAGRLTAAALDEVQAFDVRAALRDIPAPFVLVNGSRDRFRLQERALLAASGSGRLQRVRGAVFADRLDHHAEVAEILATAAG